MLPVSRRASSSGSGGARARADQRQLYLLLGLICCARWRRWPRVRPGSRCRRWCSCSISSSPGAGATSCSSSRSRAASSSSSPPPFPGTTRCSSATAWRFWNELIGDNYVNRAAGRHGDRGTFEYYLQYIGCGMFPWSGLVAVGGAARACKFCAARRCARRRCAALRSCGSWSTSTVIAWSTPSSTTTSCRRCRALAILAALFLDELLRAPTRWHACGASALLALPMTLARAGAIWPPSRRASVWLFNYDYVNAPGTGRPWPLESIYGERYEYGPQILAMSRSPRGAGRSLALDRSSPGVTARVPRDEDERRAPMPRSRRRPRADGAPALRARRAVACPSASPGQLMRPVDGPRPGAARSRAGLAGPDGADAGLARRCWFVAFGAPRRQNFSRPSCLAAGGARAPVVWTGFILDRFLVELSPHWAQKHVIAAYFADRKGPEEPLIAWQLYWRGENFYTRNEICDPTKNSSRREDRVPRRQECREHAEIFRGAQRQEGLLRGRARALRDAARPFARRCAADAQDRGREQQQALPGVGDVGRGGAVTPARAPLGTSRDDLR